MLRSIKYLEHPKLWLESVIYPMNTINLHISEYLLSRLISNLKVYSVSLIVCICSFGGSWSYAQSNDDVLRAVELDKEAKKLIEKGKFYEATEKYREALSIIEHPDLLINLARAEIELGEAQSAYNACSKALASPLLTPQARDVAMSCVQEAQSKMNEIRAFVSTYPVGAKLRLDGRSLGQTPWEGQLAPGRRQFDLELSGHLPVSRSVNAVPGARLKLQVRLIPEGMGGLLTLNTLPEGANVILDSEFIGQTPINTFPTSTGSHKIQVILKGHLTESHQISITEGKNQELNFYLKPKRGRVSATDLWPAWGMISAGTLTSILAGYFGYQALNNRNQANDLALKDGSINSYDEYRFLIRDMDSAKQTADILWVTSSVMLTSGLTWWLFAH
jgi:hypothetical protein